MNPRHLLLALWFSLTSTFGGAAEIGSAARELVVCGREEVFILDLNQQDAARTPRKIWSWEAAGRTDLPREYHPLFRSTDECKPVDDGKRILITSSSGGVALVDREKKDVVFYGRAVNAHSADLLPNGRVAVAASRDPRGNRGDALILFDLTQSDQELWRGELPSGHGVVWDEKRQVVWALADKDIRMYRLTDWTSATPKLTRMGMFPLPEGGGHDLHPVPGTAFLSVTTAKRCWLFNRDAKSIAPHPTLGDQPDIKSITQHPMTREIAYTQAERPNWWTERIRFLNPSATCSVPGEQFYKVRWNVRPE
jgi:hypothetical protein